MRIFKDTFGTPAGPAGPLRAPLWVALGLLVLSAGPTAALSPAPAASELSVPLRVVEPSGRARRDAPVSAGIPIPQAAGVRDVTRLQLVSTDGSPVPAQFRALSRWNAAADDSRAPLKWVLVDFRANATAHGRTDYTVRTGAPTAPQSSIARPLEPASMRVSVTSAGSLFADGRMISLEELTIKVGEFIARERMKSVIVIPDEDVPAGRLIEVIDAARLGGAEDVALATRNRGRP